MRPVFDLFIQVQVFFIKRGGAIQQASFSLKLLGSGGRSSTTSLSSESKEFPR
jgi:hypothetical protein